jgi:hypothetical protein
MQLVQAVKIVKEPRFHGNQTCLASEAAKLETLFLFRFGFVLRGDLLLDEGGNGIVMA